jgi:hypothetical protein
VFPVRIGKRAREAKKPSNSYAKRLRRELFRAGIHRAPPIEVPATTPGMRTDLGRAIDGTQLAPNTSDPLYYETATTLPVDFHSFRRAFASALAEAGVNVQHAMHLTAHSDPRVHSRYVMRTAAMRAIPTAALPRLPVAALAQGRARDDSGPRRDDSSPEEGLDASGIVPARDVSGVYDGGSEVRVEANLATLRGFVSSGCRTRGRSLRPAGRSDAPECWSRAAPLGGPAPKVIGFYERRRQRRVRAARPLTNGSRRLVTGAPPGRPKVHEIRRLAARPRSTSVRRGSMFASWRPCTR